MAKSSVSQNNKRKRPPGLEAAWNMEAGVGIEPASTALQAAVDPRQINYLAKHSVSQIRKMSRQEPHYTVVLLRMAKGISACFRLNQGRSK